MSNKDNINIEKSNEENDNYIQEITLLNENLDKLIKFKEEDNKKIEKQEKESKKELLVKEKNEDKNKKETEAYNKNILNLLTDIKDKEVYTDTLTLEKNTQLTNIDNSLLSLNLLATVLIVLLSINLFAKGWLGRGH